MDVGDEVAAEVLALVDLAERVGVRRFDADERLLEARLGAQVEQWQVARSRVTSIDSWVNSEMGRGWARFQSRTAAMISAERARLAVKLSSASRTER